MNGYIRSTCCAKLHTALGATLVQHAWRRRSTCHTGRCNAPEREARHLWRLQRVHDGPVRALVGGTEGCCASRRLGRRSNLPAAGAQRGNRQRKGMCTELPRSTAVCRGNLLSAISIDAICTSWPLHWPHGRAKQLVWARRQHEFHRCLQAVYGARLQPAGQIGPGVRRDRASQWQGCLRGRSLCTQRWLSITKL